MLLFPGERDYGPPIDLWGAGCIMAEMWTRSPIMQGNTEQHQLALISQLCGSITPEVRRSLPPGGPPKATHLREGWGRLPGRGGGARGTEAKP